MKRGLWITAISALAVAGCDSAPTAPPPTPVLSASESTVALSSTCVKVLPARA